MSLGQLIPSYNAAADLLENKRGSLTGFTALALGRAFMYGVAFRIAGVKDAKVLVKASLVSSALASSLLLLALVSNGHLRRNGKFKRLEGLSEFEMRGYFCDHPKHLGRIKPHPKSWRWKRMSDDTFVRLVCPTSRYRVKSGRCEGKMQTEVVRKRRQKGERCVRGSKPVSVGV